MKQTFLAIVTPLVQRIKSLEQNGSAHQNGPMTGSSGLIPSKTKVGGDQLIGGKQGTAQVGNIENKLDGLNDALNKLEMRMDEVKAEREDNDIKFAGIGTSSIEEMGVWVEIHFRVLWADHGSVPTVASNCGKGHLPEVITGCNETPQGLGHQHRGRC